MGIMNNKILSLLQSLRVLIFHEMAQQTMKEDWSKIGMVVLILMFFKLAKKARQII